MKTGTVMANVDEPKPVTDATEPIKESPEPVKDTTKSGSESEPLKETNNGATGEETEPIQLSKDLEKKIVRQLEYYFGDINLPKDKFMLQQIGLDDGWVPMTVLMTFKRLSALCSDPKTIVKVLLDSNTELIHVNDDHTKIRRNPEMPVPELNEERRQELMNRTAYVKGFEQTEQLESLMKFFEPYGPIESIVMRSYRDKAEKKWKYKGSVFVIFKDVETCKKFLEGENVKYKETDLIRKWQSAYIEEKKAERSTRTNKKEKDNKETKSEEKKQFTFPKGAVIHMKGFNDTVTREVIKQKIVEIFQSEPAFITYDKGQAEGYARFAEENNAIEFVKKLTDSKFKISEQEIEVRVLEGAEEDTFLSDVAEAISKSRTFHKGRNRKRRGGNDYSSKSKRSRK